MKKFKIFFDGATLQCNPSIKIGYGVVFGKEEHKKALLSDKFNLTNNVAEYYALGLSLKLILERFPEKKDIIIFGDSKMVCNQMNNKWQIKEGEYKKAALICKSLINRLRKLHNIELKWIPREENEHADRLSKEALKIHNY